MTESEPHSKYAFGESRDHWWNADFRKLLAKRWGLASARLGLDVGSGVGHWGRLWITHMHEDALIEGVEPEATWLEEARLRATNAGLTEQLSYRQGKAEDLPFDDETFDFVTCQTVLMHVADPEVALREMWRVLQPGGLLMAAEPNNAVTTLIRSSVDMERDLDETIELVRGDLIRSKGKWLLGAGDDSVGDRLPRLFHQLGVVEPQTYLSDKTWTMLPPYRDATARSELDELREQHNAGRHFFSEAQSRRWFVAGGGSDAQFDQWWQKTLSRDAQILKGADDHSLWAPGAGIFYVVSGRKPGG